MYTYICQCDKVQYILIVSYFFMCNFPFTLNFYCIFSFVGRSLFQMMTVLALLLVKII